MKEITLKDVIDFIENEELPSLRILRKLRKGVLSSII